MEEVVIAPDTTVSGQLEREIAVTHESLNEKIMALENQVLGSVRTAADTLTDTVGAVKSIVAEAPSVVTNSVRQAATVVGETVKDVLDVSGRVRQNPWGALGGSICLCFLVGRVTSRESQRAVSSRPTKPV